MVKAGANKEIKNKEGQTPLHLAAQMDDKKVLEALIKADANKEARDKEGKTPLHLAAHYNNIEIIKSLLANLANREAKDNNGRTPLHMSILNNSRVLEESKGALKTLLDIGVDVDVQDNYGKTPPSLCCHMERLFCRSRPGYGGAFSLYAQRGSFLGKDDS